jgi:hypothetical protein
MESSYASYDAPYYNSEINADDLFHKIAREQNTAYANKQYKIKQEKEKDAVKCVKMTEMTDILLTQLLNDGYKKLESTELGMSSYYYNKELKKIVALDWLNPIAIRTDNITWTPPYNFKNKCYDSNDPAYYIIE